VPDRRLADAGKRYAEEVHEIYRNQGRSTQEESYYPAIKTLIADLLGVAGLQFRTWTAVSAVRDSGRKDKPDIGIFADDEETLVVPAEVKLPDVEVEDLAFSTDRNDQVGRYLDRAGVVLVSNVRSAALVAANPGHVRNGNPVPPERRDLIATVNLWSSEQAFSKGNPPTAEDVAALLELVERAVTAYAPIADPATLATILARQARDAKEALPAKFDTVAGLLHDYGVALGLSFEGPEGEEFFRSSLVQTAFYGLFAGWTVWHLRNDGKPFDWDRLERYIEIPFLATLFYEFRHPDRLEELHLAPHLDRATATLGRVDRQAFFRRFLGDNGTGAALPELVRAAITYFYEPFLEAFDPALRKELGVWYTPREVIQYQVARIDHLLRNELGVRRGLADENVVVLDPCCGTGAYLLEVIRVVAGQLRAEGEDGTMGAHVLDAVCRRVIGFEILTAPFVIAQLQLWLMLTSLGVPPEKGQRPAVFLTNALTGWQGPEQVKLNFPELTAEHDAAQKVKREARIIVVLGNPPYNRFAGVPVHEEADLADHYKGITRDSKGKQVGKSALFTRWGVRKHLLDDLYVRFFRLAERQIGEKAEYGVVSFISNSSFLTGRSHPLMRESLLSNFHAAWIDNLNGDKYKTGKVIPRGLPGGGTSDQSAFTTEVDPRGIQVGAAITTWLKRRGMKTAPDEAVVNYRDFWGRSSAKRQALLDSVSTQFSDAAWRNDAAKRPEGPREYVQIKPREAARWLLAPGVSVGGYEDWPSLDEVFSTTVQGVNPNRGLDDSVIDCQATELAERMRSYIDAPSFAEAARLHPGLAEARAGYVPERAWRKLHAKGFRADRIVSYLLFPLDLRSIYYETDTNLLNRRRPEFGDNLLENEFLLAVPQPRRVSESRPLVCRTLADLHVHDRGTVAFPAVVRHEASPDPDLFGTQQDVVKANLLPELWARVAAAWGLSADLAGADAIRFARNMIRLSLAILHSPQFEQDHQEALAQGWASLPIPRSPEVFENVAAVGQTVALLLDAQADPAAVLKDTLPAGGAGFAQVCRRDGHSVRPEHFSVDISYFGAAGGRWIRRAYAPDEDRLPGGDDSTGDLFINEDVYFANVPPEVWRFELGGYPVLRKWLGYRQASRRGGAPLQFPDEVRWFRVMVQRLAALVAYGPELDRAYEAAAASAWTRDELALL